MLFVLKGSAEAFDITPGKENFEAAAGVSAGKKKGINEMASIHSSKVKGLMKTNHAVRRILSQSY